MFMAPLVAPMLQAEGPAKEEADPVIKEELAPNDPVACNAAGVGTGSEE